MTEMDWKLINKRRSCAMLTHEQMNEGKVPTTPTSSSVIAGIQVQEMLKLIHKDRGLPTLAGKGFVFNGLTHDSYIVEYQEKPGCLSHDTYESIEEMPWSANETPLGEMLQTIKAELGETAVLELDRSIALAASCSCGNNADLFCPVHKLRGEMLLCDCCGLPMQFSSTHLLNGSESFLDKTPADLGIPPLHIVCGRAGATMKYYELTGDYTHVFYK